MSTGSILLRRGPTADRLAFCPLEGEIIYDTQLKRLYVGDSITYGGNNVVSDVIVNPDGLPLVLPISILAYNTISGVQLGNNLSSLTLGSGLLGASYNGSAAITASVDSASVNTANKIVVRDGLGNFAAGTITASLSGNASTATKLAASVTINSVSFDGSSNITVTANAGTLTGTTINSSVVSSSLTSVGTLTNLTVTNAITGSINGNAGTVTNGVYITGMYADPTWITSLSETKVLPAQTNNTGRYLTTNGISSSWVSPASVGFPSLVGNTGKYLTNDGTTVSWGTISSTASSITVTPTGNVASTTVQAAIAELDTEKAPIASPTLTGHPTIEGVTSTGATGTGKLIFDTSPSIASPTFTGTTTLQQTIEKFVSPSIFSNAVTLDFSTGAIFSLSSNSSNITANFTNVPTAAGQTMTVTLIISQGSNAYIPSVVTINSVSQTIKWLSGLTPAGYANKTDFVSFVFICTATSTYTVTGSLSTYG